jgi:hypothetical protein
LATVIASRAAVMSKLAAVTTGLLAAADSASSSERGRSVVGLGSSSTPGSAPTTRR